MNETELKIRKFGDKVLSAKVKPIKEVTDYHRKVLSRMARIMYETKGIGLAANQIGIDQAMIVVDIGEGLYKLINPRIVKSKGRQAMEEGCLSVPGVGINVKRAKKVTLKALDENGNSVVIDAEGLLACVFQHELDHLNGKLIVNHANLLDKIKMKKKLNSLKASQNE